MPRGGLRRGAGRPRGTGKFGESTKAIRLPVSMIDQVVKFIEQKGLCYPLIPDTELTEQPATTPENVLDLGNYLVQNPASTFMVRVTGESMIGAGIFPGDLLIVDRSIRAADGDVIIACVDGAFLVKRLVFNSGKIELHPENKNFKTVVLDDDSNLKVWGVVKNVIHRV